VGHILPRSAIATLERVSYVYPGSERPALLNVDLEIPRGQIIGIVGPTGSGKTTLCLSLNGIVPQFYGGRFFGRVTVAGLDTVDRPIHELARHVGMVFQDPETQIITASVETEVAFALENLKLPAAEIRTRVKAALEAVHLEGVAKKHPHSLSGGQQQRLAIASALAIRPELIVFDEPTSQLDPRSAEEVFSLIREISRSFGATVVIASHAAEEMASTVDRLVVLREGKVAADGPADGIYGNLPLLERAQLRPPDVTAAFSLLAARGLQTGPLPTRLADGIRALELLPKAQPFRPEVEPTFDPGILPILSLRKVSYTYWDGTRALEAVSVDIHRGDYTIILGQNGAGKSTLIKHFLNLLAPSSGEVLMDGKPVSSYSVPEIAHRIGYVPQNPDRHLFNATVETEVSFSLRVTDLPQEEKTRRVEEALATLDLTRYRLKHPFALSKGDRARVVVAAILVMEPEILIFDEPTTGQDDWGARAILELTKRLHARGKTIIVITHHLGLMPGFARRALVMGGGRILLDAPIRDAYHDDAILEKTFLKVTQIVALARAARPENYALTPTELAGSFL
jgi:energy-coupling factor transport system ATP-binding protein